MKSIGLATVDFDKFFVDLPRILSEERADKSLWEALYSRWGKKQKEEPFKTAYAAYNQEFPRISNYGVVMKDEKAQADWTIKCCTEYVQHIREMVELGTCELRCLYYSNGSGADDKGLALLSLGGSSSALLLPPEYVTVSEYRNYDALTGSERLAILSGGQKPSETSVAAQERTVNSVKSDFNGVVGSIENLKKQAEALKEGKAPEVAELKAKIDALQAELEGKVNNLLAELNVKMSEMKQKKKELEFEIYRLSSEIYSIRCYTGECVTFALIRNGKPAPETTPLVLNQKMRYMDEELGRLASIYDVDFSDVTIFEKLLKFNDMSFETFCPTKRCVTLVRVSRDNKAFTYHERYANMLDCTTKYRGRAIAILIRDGDKLYMGWTDEEHVDFADDMFFLPGESKEDVEPKLLYESDEDYEKRMEKHRLHQLEEAVSRSFIFSILQGIIDRKMIAFPAETHVKINRPSDFVVRNYADTWITDERYGSFNKLMKRCNESIRQGDSILTMQYLRPETRNRSLGWRDERWNNSRGIGDRNRTHDVSAKDCEIYKVNKVLTTATYIIQFTGDDGKLHKSEYNDRTRDDIQKILDRNYWKNATIAEVINKEDHYYISLKKQWSLSGEARANFEVFRNEFVNLTFMNSIWLEYVLQTQKTGVICIGGEEINFAHLIPYLKTALDHVRKREAAEKELLVAEIPELESDAEWPAKLSEWKLEHNIHNITPYQAKRFATHWLDQATSGKH